MIEQVVTTKITIINIVIALGGIAIIVYYLMENYPKLLDEIAQKLERSLSREAEDKSQQPLYLTFYKYQHSSIQTWARWVESQDEKIQARAFRKLKKYLEQPLQKLGSLAVEVTKAVVELNRTDSFAVLADLIFVIKDNWGKYKALEAIYREACKGLVILDPVRAKVFLSIELEDINKRKNVDSMKVAIMDAFLLVPKFSEIESVFEDLLMDGSQSLEIREYTLDIIDRSSNELIPPLYRTILKRFIYDDNRLGKIDMKILQRLLHKIQKYLDQEKCDIWEMMMEACEAEHIAPYSVEVICDMVANPEKSFSTAHLHDVYSITGKHSSEVSQALAKRFNLSQEELGIVLESKQLNKNILTKDIILIKKETDLEIAPMIHDKYLELEEHIIKRQMPKKAEGRVKALLMTGIFEDEKLDISRIIASRNRKSFVYLDIKAILSAPDLLNKLEEQVTDNLPCILYLDNFRQILIEQEGAKQKRTDKLVNLIDKLANNNGIFIVANLPTDPDNPDQHSPNLMKLKRSTFNCSYQMKEASVKQKRNIFKLYSLKLDKSRGAEHIDFELIVDKTQGLSSSNFLNYILEYIKKGLLVSGKLTAIE